MNQPIQHYPNAIPKSEIARLIGPKPNPIVLEIGCNDGQDSEQLMRAIPGVYLFCFEPDRRPLHRWRQRVGLEPPAGHWYDIGDSSVWVFETAIGETDGVAEFHPSCGKAGHMDDWDLSGSIHQPTGHLARSPEIGFLPPIPVPIVRLDTWAARHLKSAEVVDFIWCDCQGSQADVYRGGVETLKRTRYLLQEFYPNPLYAGEPNLNQQLHMLGPDWELIAFYQNENFLARNRRL